MTLQVNLRQPGKGPEGTSVRGPRSAAVEVKRKGHAFLAAKEARAWSAHSLDGEGDWMRKWVQRTRREQLDDSHTQEGAGCEPYLPAGSYGGPARYHRGRRNEW